MTTNDADANESIDLNPRDVRALTEYMSVLPEGGDIYTVVGQNGGTYTVDAREDRCTCPDYEHNLPTEDGRERCKHRSRVAFATGETVVPAWIDTDAVDEQLGLHVEATPRVAATDGGQLAPEVAEAVTDAEIDARAERDAVDDETDERPDECICGPTTVGEPLPCFECWMAGYETPADVDEDDAGE